MQSHQLTRPQPVGFFQSPNVAGGGPIEKTGIMQTHDELLEKFTEGYAKYGTQIALLVTDLTENKQLLPKEMSCPLDLNLEPSAFSMYAMYKFFTAHETINSVHLVRPPMIVAS